ncbi:hypothetical protein [Bacillus cereus]|uniref:hypothetical protein n=1 Tax=Bacillus cereus TaxID=1396 RepID=UPI000943D062|nr:hypothetical protein [Bacillus cereus]
MNLVEMQGIHSVEGFLLDEELKTITQEIDSVLKMNGASLYRAGMNGNTVHSIPGYDVKEVVDIYEPNGRIEIVDLPEKVLDLLDKAFYRSLDNIKVGYPSVKKPDCWIYFEYGRDEYITPHVDYPHNESRPDNLKVTGINILLNEDFFGGEFYVETCGSKEIWENNGEKLKNGLNWGSEWFKNLPTTRWTCQQEKGTAIFYGTNVIHGTHAVKSGRTKKIVGFVTN